MANSVNRIRLLPQEQTDLDYTVWKTDLVYTVWSGRLVRILCLNRVNFEIVRILNIIYTFTYGRKISNETNIIHTGIG